MNLPPSTSLVIVVSLVAVGTAGVAWWATRWWFMRQVAAGVLRLRKSEQARALLLEQAQQTRRQIESLTKTLEAERAQAARLDASRRRARELESAWREPERAVVPTREPMDLALSMPMPLDAPMDFADTQILN